MINDMDNTTEHNDIMAELKPKCKVKASQHLHNEISRMCDLQPKRNRGKIITFLGAVSSVAAILIAVFFTPSVSAKELLDDAIKNLGTIRTMIMVLDVRTLVNENFDHIELDAEFIPHIIQVKYEADGKTWRVDKGGRISCGDSQLQYLWITSTHLGWKTQSSHEPFVGFIDMFLEPQKILEAEYYLAKKQHNNNYKVEKKGNELVLTVHAHPQV